MESEYLEWQAKSRATPITNSKVVKQENKNSVYENSENEFDKSHGGPLNTTKGHHSP